VASSHRLVVTWAAVLATCGVIRRTGRRDETRHHVTWRDDVTWRRGVMTWLLDVTWRRDVTVWHVWLTGLLRWTVVVHAGQLPDDRRCRCRLLIPTSQLFVYYIYISLKITWFSIRMSASVVRCDWATTSRTWQRVSAVILWRLDWLTVMTLSLTVILEVCWRQPTKHWHCS